MIFSVFFSIVTVAEAAAAASVSFFRRSLRSRFALIADWWTVKRGLLALGGKEISSAAWSSICPTVIVVRSSIRLLFKYLFVRMVVVMEAASVCGEAPPPPPASHRAWYEQNTSTVGQSGSTSTTSTSSSADQLDAYFKGSNYFSQMQAGAYPGMSYHGE